MTQLRDLPPTIGAICERVFDIATAGHHYVIFSTDSYDPDSIKSLERRRRGCAPERIVSGPSMVRPPSMSSFLANDKNKHRFNQLMLQVWSDNKMAPKIRDKCVVLIEEGSAYELSSNGTEVLPVQLEYLHTSQEETDTKVILYCNYAVKKKLKNVIIKTVDSDIFFILLYHAAKFKSITIYLDTAIQGRSKLFNISSLANKFGEQHCSELLGLHAFTGSDTTSAFKGIGKVRPYKKIQKYRHFGAALSQLGDNAQVKPETQSALEKFTCKFYRDTNETSLDNLRYTILKSEIEKCKKARETNGKERKTQTKRNIDLSRLPPPSKCVFEYGKRCNYQVAQWKAANERYPRLEKHDNGWIYGDGEVEPNWLMGDIMPNALLDNLDNADTNMTVDDTDDESSTSGSDADEIDSDDDSDDEL